MKKKIAFLLMIVVIVGAGIMGMSKSLTEGHAKLIEIYQDEGNDFSVGNAIEQSVDKIQNMVKLAVRYKDSNSRLEPLYQAIEDKLAVLYLDETNLADSQTLKELYSLSNNLLAELEDTGLNEEDQKYPQNLMVEILSLRDQISHADYNQKAADWNQKYNQFPATFLRTIKIGDIRLADIKLLPEYSDL